MGQRKRGNRREVAALIAVLACTAGKNSGLRSAIAVARLGVAATESAENAAANWEKAAGLWEQRLLIKVLGR